MQQTTDYDVNTCWTTVNSWGMTIRPSSRRRKGVQVLGRATTPGSSFRCSPRQEWPSRCPPVTAWSPGINLSCRQCLQSCLNHARRSYHSCGHVRGIHLAHAATAHPKSVTVMEANYSPAVHLPQPVDGCTVRQLWVYCTFRLLCTCDTSTLL